MQKNIEFQDTPGLAASMIWAPKQNLRNKEVCLFVAYSPDGKTGSGLEYFLNSFVNEGIEVVLCLITEEHVPSIDLSRFRTCSAVMTRLNRGYDFGAWAGIIRALPELWEAKRLFFVNDSIVGPNKNFPQMLQRIRASESGFVALTANYIDTFHAQSYFFCYGRAALSSDNLRTIWTNLPDYENKTIVIQQCEQKQLLWMAESEVECEILYRPDLLAKISRNVDMVHFNPTRDSWAELLEMGFPFIKADMFYRYPNHLRQWRKKFGDASAERAEEQVKDLVNARFRGAIIESHSSLNFFKVVLGKERFFRLRSWWKKRNVFSRIR